MLSRLEKASNAADAPTLLSKPRIKQLSDKCRWDVHSTIESESDNCLQLLNLGLLMPLDGSIPAATRWRESKLQTFGLTSKASAAQVSLEWAELGDVIVHQARAAAKSQTAVARIVAEAEAEAEAEAARAAAEAKAAAARAAAEAKAAAARAAAEAKATARAEAAQRRKGLQDAARVLKRHLTKPEPAALSREINRILALDTEPSDEHEAAVYRQFKWMRLACEDMFTGWKGTDSRGFLARCELRADLVDTQFQSEGWRHSSTDGELVAASLEDGAFGAAGVKQVKATYQTADGKNTQVVALCMYVPAVGLNPGTRKDMLKMRQLSLPGGGNVVIGGHSVEMQPFVLTMPRFDMFLRLREAARTIGLQGMQLTGVHGAGKSHTLQVLSSILVHGGRSELLFHQEAVNALDGLDKLLEGVSPTSDVGGLLQMLFDSETVEELFGEPGEQGAAHDALASLKADFAIKKKATGGVSDELAMFKALLAYMKKPAHPGQARVIIFDEVNKLLKRIGTEVGRTKAWSEPRKADRPAVSVAGFLEEWVEWLTGPERGVLRILSASPHGAREYVADVSVSPQFELRPTRADQLGAVAAVAPEYLLPTASVGELAASREKWAKVLPLSKAVAVCDELGSNMRYLSRCLTSIDANKSVEVAVSAQFDRLTGVMSDRLLRGLAAGGLVKQEKGKDPEFAQSEVRRADLLSQLCITDASMTVCEDQEQPHKRVLAGRASSHAAYSSLMSLAKNEQTGPNAAIVLHQLVRLAGEKFEPLCAARLYWRCLTREAAKMPPRTGTEDPVKLQQLTFPHVRPAGDVQPHASGAQDATAPGLSSSPLSAEVVVRDAEQPVDAGRDAAAQTGSTALGTALRLLKPGARLHVLPSHPDGNASILQEQVVSVCRKLLNDGGWGRVLVETVHHFPAMDMVELEQVGSTMYVRVFEVTESTIKDHAQGKHVVKALMEPVPAGKKSKDMQKVKIECPQVWGDIFHLCATPRRTAQLQKDGTVKLTRLTDVQQSVVVCDDAVGDLKSGTSMLNAVLASLGVPLVVRRTVAAGKAVKEDKEGTGPDKRTISNLELSVHRSSELCEELFGGPEGSGDHRLWGADGVDNWELQVVYVSNKPQRASDRAMLESQDVLTAPFVRYVFAEHMRDVFPVKRT